MNYLIGVDLGTSGTKTVLFDTEGTVISSATVEYPMYQPKNGWAEQAPEDWWDATMRTTKKVIEDSGVDSKDIKGMGISGQMHGLVMLDENGSVLRRSIIWCDQRTARECEEITERVGAKRLIEITANPALPGFTASKILWVRNHEPEIYAKCRHILLPKDYVRYMLTGEFATEVSDASGMQLLDIPNRCWSDEVLEKLDIDKSMLAKVYESPEITGYITEEAAKLTGLAAGLSLKWFRDNFFLEEMQTAKGMGVDPYYLMDRQAERAPIGANRLVYLPYLMGERSPKLDSDCRGVFFGLSAMHTKYDMLRAVMEGVIYSQRECLDILRGMGVVSSEMLACGGGGSSPMWRQMMADVYNLPVKTVVSKEGPALGVAILAGVGAGIYPSVAEACRKVVKTNPAQAPIPENTGRYEEFYRVYCGLYPQLKDCYKALAAL